MSCAYREALVVHNSLSLYSPSSARFSGMSCLVSGHRALNYLQHLLLLASDLIASECTAPGRGWAARTWLCPSPAVRAALRARVYSALRFFFINLVIQIVYVFMLS